jgi:hypothetical protein
MSLQGRLDGIQPLNCVEEITQAVVGQYFLDPERDHGEPGGKSLGDFAINMIGAVRMLRENQDENPARVNSVQDSFGPAGSCFDIAGSDPAFDVLGLELMANRIGYHLILGGMADEDPGLHLTFAASRFSRMSGEWLAQKRSQGYKIDLGIMATRLKLDFREIENQNGNCLEMSTTLPVSGIGIAIIFEFKKIVFPNRLKDRSFSVDKADEAKRRTRSGFFTPGRTEVGVKRRAGFGWSQPGFF